MSVLRAELADWIERVRGGEEVVVTDRGIPVARLIAVDATPPAAARPARQARLSVPSSAGRPAGPGRSWEEGEMSSRLSTRRPGGARRIVAVVCVVALAILASSCSSPRPTTPKSASPAAASLRALE